MTERTKGTSSAIAALDQRFDDAARPAVDVPHVASFKEFLLTYARVRLDSDTAARTGQSYGPFTFKGRHVLEFIVDQIDAVLGSHTGIPLEDAELDICGGAQFGKTVLMLNLIAYLTGCRFMNVGYYLPDDDLVQGIVDTKFRPDVIDQIDWYAAMTLVGKSMNQSGKAVNRKGAFMVTNGQRTGLGYIRGMGKIPTSFSMDVLIEDEKDDIPDAMAKFLPGRLTSSKLRFRIAIGTQRLHGAGQNAKFEGGTQHVGQLRCAACGHTHELEENWPGIVRLAMDPMPHPSDPQLTLEGDFKRGGSGSTIAAYDHDGHYYFACVKCGAELDREKLTFEPRRPERIKERKTSIRVSQLTTPAIDLKQVVGDWCQNAVKDPDAMMAFKCDRLAMPQSTAQSLTPQVLARGRNADPFNLSLTPRPGAAVFGGLDTGDRCWFSAKDRAAANDKRVVWLEQMSSERVRSRVPQLFVTLGMRALFVDAGPLRDLARDLCMILNGLVGFDFSKLARVPDAEKAHISFGNGLAWDGPNGRWVGLRCAAVEFTMKEAKGVVHKLGKTQDGMFYPIIACNRNETIQHVINELLTAEEGVIEVVDGKLRTAPTLRLPAKGPGASPVVELHESHLLTGSRKDKDGQFIDECENHFLLADSYATLAETVGGSSTAKPFAYRKVETAQSASQNERRVLI